MAGVYQYKCVIDMILNTREPRHKILENDLQQLATYLVRIGTNVEFLRLGFKQKRFSKYPELNVVSLKDIVRKYRLTWSQHCQFKDFDPIRNFSLHHIAHCHFDLFIRTAASLAPGGYEERRFWWCANNYHFFLRNKERVANATELAAGDGSQSNISYLSSGQMRKKSSWNPQLAYSTSRLLSDVLCHLLTLDEPKLIAINALHLSVKHSDSQVFLVWYERNYNWLLDQIKADEFGGKNPSLKESWRKCFRIKETERELDTIHVDFFIEWWNLTGLRRPTHRILTN